MTEERYADPSYCMFPLLGRYDVIVRPYHMLNEIEQRLVRTQWTGDVENPGILWGNSAPGVMSWVIPEHPVPFP